MTRGGIKYWTERMADSNSGDELVFRRKKALYRAQHRGTKDMDWMIGRYAEARLAQMNGDRLALFDKFLAIPDPELNHWLLEPNACEHQDFAPLIQDIRAFHAMT